MSIENQLKSTADSAVNSSSLVPLSAILAVALFLFNIVVGALAFSHGIAEMDEFSILSFGSLALFIVVTIAAMMNRHVYVLALPFMLLAFPSMVNDYSISLHLGPPNEIGASLFPILTHIDIFLLAGIIAHSPKTPLEQTRNSLSFMIVLLLGLYSVVTASFSVDLYELTLFAAGNYQIRYLLLFIILANRLPEIFNLRTISLSLAGSMIFLLVESYVYTDINELDRLTSGTLRNNVFANIVAAIAIFFAFLKSSTIGPIIGGPVRLVVILIGLLIVYMTGTKMAFLNVMAVFLLVVACRLHWNRVYILSFAAISVYVAGAFVLNQSERFASVVTIFESLLEGDVLFSKSTSSVLTRFVLNDASIQMINSHPAFGVGVGRWNHLKSDYGVPYNALLDPHNGYLAFLSQYGVILGIALILVFIAVPSLIYIKRRLSGDTDNIVALYIIPLSLVLPEITNANSFKPQIAAFLAFIAIAALFKVHRHAQEPQ